MMKKLFIHVLMSMIIISKAYAEGPCKGSKNEIYPPCKSMKCQSYDAPEKRKIVSIKERKERLVQKRNEQAAIAEKQAQEKKEMMVARRMEMNRKREEQKQIKMEKVNKAKIMKVAKVKSEKEMYQVEQSMQPCRKKMREISRDRAMQILKKMGPEKIAALKKECSQKMKTAMKEVS